MCGEKGTDSQPRLIAMVYASLRPFAPDFAGPLRTCLPAPTLTRLLAPLGRPNEIRV